MAESTTGAAQAKSKSSKLLIPRILFWGTLLTLLGLSFLDFRAKKNAEATLQKLDDARTEALNAERELRKSKIAEHLIGSPQVSEIRPAKKEGKSLVKQAVDLNFGGILRKYRVVVYFSLGENPAVEEIDLLTSADPPSATEPLPPPKVHADDEKSEDAEESEMEPAKKADAPEKAAPEKTEAPEKAVPEKAEPEKAAPEKADPEKTDPAK